MSQARKKSKTTTVQADSGNGKRKLALSLTLAAFAIYHALALTTHNPLDPGYSTLTTPPAGGVIVENLGGPYGAYLADFSLFVFGRAAFILPFLFAYGCVQVWLSQQTHRHSSIIRLLSEVVNVVLVLGCLASLEHLLYSKDISTSLIAGGLIGNLVVQWISPQIGQHGSIIILMTILLISLAYLLPLPWLAMLNKLTRGVLGIGRYLSDLLSATGQWLLRVMADSRHNRSRQEPSLEPDARKIPAQRSKTVKKTEVSPVTKQPVSVDNPLEQKFESYQRLPGKRRSSDRSPLPSLQLLDEVIHKEIGYSDDEMRIMSAQVVEKLQDYKIQVEVRLIQPGPVVTRFEIDPAPGVKASQISGLARDLARALSVISVRVIENIPGKSTVGLEVPNNIRELVFLREVLSSTVFRNSKATLPIALGKDISGNPVVSDISTMPHLLVAGTTGAGKSVCINTLLLSFLFRFDADQLRLIMIDPKMLELSVYDGLPHLLTPVITDMELATTALRWCIAEMDRRFQLMSALGVRNIKSLNQKIEIAVTNGKPITDPLQPEDGEPVELVSMPYIVVVIDEFADLFMVIGKKIEALIIRIAQRARAAGIHLVLATQRPSVDVITGLIKANIPSRIAFRVSSRADSRTILDKMGAEQLLGDGDMLFLPPGKSYPIRVHGAFTSDKEVHQVVGHIKARGKPDYNPTVIVEESAAVGNDAGFNGNGDGEADPLYDQVVQMITESRRVSISLVQRHFRIGYNRAARLVEAMEQAGVISAPDSQGKRQVIAPAPS